MENMCEKNTRKDFPISIETSSVDTITNLLHNGDAIVDLNDAVNFSECVGKRTINIGNIEDGIGSSVDMLIRFWNHYDEEKGIEAENRVPIKLYINSNGGSLIEAITIIDSIRLSKTPVWTIVNGTAYSAGLQIAAAGHKRFCYPNASYLFHEGSVGNVGGVDAGKFKNFSDFYQRILEKSKVILLENTKITKRWYTEHARDDVWMFAEDALKLGIVDEISNSI